ncbi:Chaperone protein DnaK [bioreactor metagenome]|uniref:Chaperone protein DnaK n=1 Tax=bioreactor metagenome TaxID=1076179 RepID=A0A645ET59_9ZZZZ
MSKDDIDKAVKEAEMYAAEDKNRREEIDIRNQAEQAVYQAEKTVEEMGDKMSADEKTKISDKINALKETLKSGGTDEIKAKSEDLSKAFYDISSKIYQQGGPGQNGGNPGAGPDNGGNPSGFSGAPGGDNVYEADYTEVPDDKK